MWKREAEPSLFQTQKKKMWYAHTENSQNRIPFLFVYCFLIIINLFWTWEKHFLYNFSTYLSIDYKIVSCTLYEVIKTGKQYTIYVHLIELNGS